MSATGVPVVHDVSIGDRNGRFRVFQGVQYICSPVGVCELCAVAFLRVEYDAFWVSQLCGALGLHNEAALTEQPCMVLLAWAARTQIATCLELLSDVNRFGTNVRPR